MHGPFHGDVHAGNLWVLDDGRATYLDFGIMGEVPRGLEAVLRDLFFTSMIDGDFPASPGPSSASAIFTEEAGTDEEVGTRLQMAFGPMLDVGIGAGEPGRGLQGHRADDGAAIGAESPQELVLVTKQLLYFERYAEGAGPRLGAGPRPLPREEHLPRRGRQEIGRDGHRRCPSRPTRWQRYDLADSGEDRAAERLDVTMTFGSSHRAMHCIERPSPPSDGRSNRPGATEPRPTPPTGPGAPGTDS